MAGNEIAGESNPKVEPQAGKPIDPAALADALLQENLLLAAGGPEPIFSPEQAAGNAAVLGAIGKGVVKQVLGNKMETAGVAATGFLAAEIPAVGTIALAGTLAYGLYKGTRLAADGIEGAASALYQGAKEVVTGRAGEIPGQVKNFYNNTVNGISSKVEPKLEAMKTVYVEAMKTTYGGTSDNPKLPQANAELESMGSQIVPPIAGLLGGGASGAITRGELGSAAASRAREIVSSVGTTIKDLGRTIELEPAYVTGIPGVDATPKPALGTPSLPSAAIAAQDTALLSQSKDTSNGDKTGDTKASDKLTSNESSIDWNRFPSPQEFKTRIEAVLPDPADKATSLRVKLQRVEDGLNAINAELGLPPVKIKVQRRTDVPAYAEYSDGTVLLNARNITKMEPDDVIAFLAHENMHHNQKSIVTAKLIQEVTGSSGSLSIDQLAAVQTRFGRTISKEFIQSVDHARTRIVDGKPYRIPLSEDEMHRASLLETSIRESRKIAEQVNAIGKIRGSLAPGTPREEFRDGLLKLADNGAIKKGDTLPFSVRANIRDLKIVTWGDLINMFGDEKLEIFSPPILDIQRTVRSFAMQEEKELKRRINFDSYSEQEAHRIGKALRPDMDPIALENFLNMPPYRGRRQ